MIEGLEHEVFFYMDDKRVREAQMSIGRSEARSRTGSSAGDGCYIRHDYIKVKKKK
jgi:hypothetical protein